MGAETLGDDVANFHFRVKRRIRILEDNLYFLCDVFSVFAFQGMDIFSFIKHFAVCTVINSDAGTAACGLATAGLTNDAQCLTLSDKEGNIVHSL